MGPMGPIMGGGPGGNGAGSWSWLVLLTFLVLAVGLVVLATWPGRASAERRPHSPEEVLRHRYARGELTQRQYREALVDVLKDRYVRGELELAEYETRLSLLLGDERLLAAGKAAPGPSWDTARADSIASSGGRR